ncbi:MAG: ABC transporter permease [Planctomycetota bacterium]
MNFLESIVLALEALSANRFRSVLTMLGIIIGVCSVILLVSIGEGAKAYVVAQFNSLGTNVLIVTPGKTQTSGGPPIISSTVHPLTVGDARALSERCPRLDMVAPVVFGMSAVKYMNRTRNSPILGTTWEFGEIRNLRVEVGSFIPKAQDYSEKRVCVLGRTVKKELFGEDNPLGKMVSIGGSKFRVIGVMKKKGRSLGLDLDDLVFVPARAAQQLYSTEALLEILMNVPRESDLKPAQGEVKEILMQRHEDEEDFTVHDQGDMLSILQTLLTALTYALGGIAAISLLVGGIGIMNIMLVSVHERTREIGIRKAVGAKRRHILAQFIIESVVLSSIGGMFGVGLGVGIGETIAAFVEDFPIQVSGWTVGMAFGFSFLVGVFFGVYPARRASHLDPIEALRFE